MLRNIGRYRFNTDNDKLVRIPISLNCRYRSVSYRSSKRQFDDNDTDTRLEYQIVFLVGKLPIPIPIPG